MSNPPKMSTLQWGWNLLGISLFFFVVWLFFLSAPTPEEFESKWDTWWGGRLKTYTKPSVLVEIDKVKMAQRREMERRSYVAPSNSDDQSADSNSTPAPAITPNAFAAPNPVQKEPPALPPNGQLIVKPGYQLTASLRISNRTGKNCIVKLVDHRTRKEIMSVFVHTRKTIQVKAPLGDFIVKFACGDQWLGSDQLFGPQTIITQSASPLVISNPNRAPKLILEPPHRYPGTQQLRDSDF